VRGLTTSHGQPPALTQRGGLQSEAEFAKLGWRVSSIRSKSHRLAEHGGSHTSSIISNTKIRSIARKFEIDSNHARPRGNAVINQISDCGREVVSNFP
jgi:hypothetical protein